MTPFYFYVFDKRTGEPANIEKIANTEDWAKDLDSSDIDGFYVGSDGSLILADQCGNYVPADLDRFEVYLEV